MDNLIAIKRSLISNFSKRTTKDAELLICQCFPRQMDEVEEIAASCCSIFETPLSQKVEIVSSEIMSKYAQLKPILQNLESHTLLIRSWVTFIYHEFDEAKDVGILTPDEAFSKLQQVVNYCNQSLDCLSAYLSQNEELQEKCKTYKDNFIFCQEAEYLNKRHVYKINSMPQEIKEKFLILTSVIFNILVMIRPTRSVCNKTSLTIN